MDVLLLIAGCVSFVGRNLTVYRINDVKVTRHKPVDVSLGFKSVLNSFAQSSVFAMWGFLKTWATTRKNVDVVC